MSPRIVFLQTPQGGLLTEQEARVQAALEELKCADCWPWEKYRQDGETERSSKRGIAIENSLLTAEALSGLSQIISWGATWEHNITDGPDLSVWKMAGVDFVPMIWGAGTIPLAEVGGRLQEQDIHGLWLASGLPSSSSALLGFNEPNFPNQPLSTGRMLNNWRLTMAFRPSSGAQRHIPGRSRAREEFGLPLQVDAIGIHVFTCYAAGLKYHLDRYRIFGKPMWITEIACSDPASPERLSAEGQMAYMREAIPLLEADEDVAKYAWFSYFKDEWAHPIVPSLNGDAGLVHPNGTLTPLGNLYNSFAAGSNLTEINITEPEQLANWRMRWMMMGV
ncbi:unnamed protein product [Durusdinium trenchii]|uniref:Asl1-like glycosyl hydrolase catalytic domain-containing protein n=1 Tax=Durusdinium trenchii TaxID=1381693 RepID=A0ABP0KIM4_9DINO